MARQFVTSNIIDPIKAPFTKRSLTHLNAGLTESLSEIVKGLIGAYTPNDLIVWSGCVVTPLSGSIPGTGTASLSAGAIYYNGEVYQVDANALLSTTTPQTLVWQIVTTYISGDPATFSDGNPYNFHRIDKMKLVAGTAGSGLANYNGATVKKLFTIIDSDWVSVSVGSLLNGWSFPTNGYLKYKKDLYGNVHLKGYIDSPSSLPYQSMYALPSGYRPFPSLGIQVVPFNALRITGVTMQGRIQGNTGDITLTRTDASDIASSESFLFYTVFSSKT